jgi:hypothetical protein
LAVGERESLGTEMKSENVEVVFGERGLCSDCAAANAAAKSHICLALSPTHQIQSG